MTSIHVKPVFSGATDREKDQARQKLASDIARFGRRRQGRNLGHKRHRQEHDQPQAGG